MEDPKLHAPATQRNRLPILAVLQRILPTRGVVLEIASGSGEHAAFFAAALPDLTFQPTDRGAGELASIDAHCAGLANVRPALALDAAADWPALGADAVLCINMIHIAPWAAAVGLVRAGAAVLPPGAPLLLYGPFKRDGAHTAPSNVDFDAWLHALNPEYGVRDLEAVTELAQAHGFSLPQIDQMPANNFCVTFWRVAAR